MPSVVAVWQYRDGRDAYSGLHSHCVCCPEKDHVMEIQLLDAAYKAYFADVNAHRILRDEYLRIVELANCLENTNMTSQDINRSKKGPFTKAKNELLRKDFDHRYCGGVDSYFYENGRTRRSGLYSGLSTRNWENIKSEVVVSYDYISERIPDAVCNERNSEIFQDYLQEVFMSLKIER